MRSPTNSEESIYVPEEERADKEVEEQINSSTPEKATAPVRGKAYRWTITILLSGLYFVANFSIGALTPAWPKILEEFGPLENADAYQSLVVSIWGYGQAAGPLFMGPVSERLGRLPVLHVSTLLFIVFCAGGALSTNVQMIIGFRFLMGLTNTSSALNGPIIGDLFPVDEQARAIAFNSIISVFGTGIGPIGGGLITDRIDWRWSFWLTAIITAFFEIPLLLVYRESYKPKLEGTIEKAKSWGSFAGQMLRPFKMMVMAPVVLLISLYGTVAYGFAYIIFATIVEMFTDVYGFSLAATSYSYVGVAIGMLICGVIYILFMDKYIQMRVKRVGGKVKAEYYLPAAFIGGFLMPIGYFVYGWTAQLRGPWIVCFVGTAIYSGGVIIFMCVANNYLVIAFGRYAASAIAASMVMRFLGSALFPLAGPPLYSNLGYGWGNSLLAFITLAFMVVPAILMRYGEKLRSFGPFKNLSQES